MNGWLFDYVNRVPSITDVQIAEMRHILPVMQAETPGMYQLIDGGDKVDPRADVSALLERLTSKVTPTVIAYVDGGCVQGAKASHDVKFQVLDNDNVKAGDPGEVTLQQYESLPVAAY